jgi:hypothetical protein
LEIEVRPVSNALLGDLEALSRVEKAVVVDDRLHLHGTMLHLSIPQIVAYLHEQGKEILSIRTLMPTLEDEFVRLTGVDPEAMRVDKPQRMGGGA